LKDNKLKILKKINRQSISNGDTEARQKTQTNIHQWFTLLQAAFNANDTQQQTIFKQRIPEYFLCINFIKQACSEPQSNTNITQKNQLLFLQKNT